MVELIQDLLKEGHTGRIDCIVCEAHFEICIFIGKLNIFTECRKAEDKSGSYEF